MSSRHALAGVLTLNRTVLPRFTLMSVAKPWIVGSPLSRVGMSHSVFGDPGRQFSRSMSLAGAAHELYAFDETTSATSSAEHRHSSQSNEKVDVVFLVMSFPARLLCDTRALSPRLTESVAPALNRISPNRRTLRGPRY